MRAVRWRRRRLRWRPTRCAISTITYRRVSPHEIQPGEAPTIDGDPSEAVWQKAQAIDEFYQVDPKPGEPASDSNLLPGKVGQADLFYARSMSNKKGDEDTYSVNLNYPNEPYGGDMHFRQIG